MMDSIENITEEREDVGKASRQAVGETSLADFPKASRWVFAKMMNENCLPDNENTVR